MAIQEKEQNALLARNSILNLVGQVLPLLVGIATIPYILKALGTDGFGILSIAWMLLGYFGIFDLGLSRATTKFVAEYLHPDKVHKLPGLVWTSVALQLLLGFGGAILVAALVPLTVNRLFKMPPLWVGEAKTSLFILCAALPILLCSNALRGVLEAAQRFDLVNYIKMPASISLYVLAALAIPFGIRVWGIVLLSVLSRVIAAGAYLAFCFRVFPQLRTQLSLSIVEMRSLASFGRWVMISNTAGPTYAYLERFLIATVLSVSMLGLYSAPFELASRVLIFPGSVAPTLFPFFSYHRNRGAAVISDVTSRALKFLLFVMTPITVGFVFFAREIMQLWLGPEFASKSTVVLQLLAISFFLNAFALIPYTSVQALGRPDLKAILDVLALPAFAISAWLLMQYMGINGAALAKLLITVVDCTFLFGFAWKLKAFSLRDCISGPLFRALLASGGLILAAFLIEFFHAPLPVAFFLLLACFACYAATFWFVAVDGDDRTSIKSLSPQLLSKR